MFSSDMRLSVSGQLQIGPKSDLQRVLNHTKTNENLQRESALAKFL